MIKSAMFVDTSSYCFPDRMRVGEPPDRERPEFSQVIEAMLVGLADARRSMLDAVGAPVPVSTGVGLTLLGNRYAVVQSFGEERLEIEDSGEQTIAPGGMAVLPLTG